jgi:glycosyltransferase involved in cell wall biosynthesis
LLEIGNFKMALAAPAEFREGANQNVKCSPFDYPFAANGDHGQSYILPALTAHVQIIWFKGLARSLRSFFRTQSASQGRRVFICAAEPYSLTAFFAWWIARFSAGSEVQFVCYAAQNIFKKLPFVLKQVQQFVFKHSRAVLVIGKEQEAVLRRHGYQGRTIDFPLWFDSGLFRCRLQSTTHHDSDRIVIGYAGGLTEAKGVFDWLACCEQQVEEWKNLVTFVFAGAGSLSGRVQEECEKRAAKGLDVNFRGALPAESMPEFYQGLDILIVPSRTTPHWKEQFGRVIVEAKACGVIVVGSDSGEIPRVIGDESRIFAEGDLAAMARVVSQWIAALQEQDREKLKLGEAEQAYLHYSDVALARRFNAALYDLIQNN